MTRANDLFNQQPYNVSAGADTVNRAGHPAFTKDLKDRYLQMLMTNTLGNSFYVGQQENVEASMNMHREMLEEDAEYMAKVAIYARENGYTRLQPTIALAFLSTHENKAPFYAAFKRVILTPNNMFDFVTVASSIRQGKGFGRSMKRAIGEWYNSLSEYHVMKYGSESKTNRTTGAKSYDMKDLLKLVRPVPENAKQKELFKYILDKEVDFTKLPQLGGYEALKTETDMEKVRQLITDSRIPHEVATGVVSKPDLQTWTAIMKQMPIFALLRNLNTLQKHGVLDDATNRAHVVSVLTNEQQVTRSKILPYRFLTAFEVYQGWQEVKDALRSAINLAFKNVPEIAGTNHISIDISGSMQGDRIKQASIFGVATYMKAPDAELTLFNTMLHDPAISRQDSLMTNVAKLPAAGGGTALVLPVQHLLGTIQSGEAVLNGFYRTQVGYHSSYPLQRRSTKATKVDNIIIVTDEQQNAGTPLANEFEKYRRTVNKDAKLFIINVAGYDGFSMPKEDPNVFYIFGWSDQVLQYVSYVSHGFAGQREHVEAIQLHDNLVAQKK